MTNPTDQTRLVQPETGSQSATLVKAAYAMARLLIKLFGPYFRVTVLADMVLKAGVEEADRRCREENNGKKPTYSRLVMLTGLNNERLKTILAQPKELGDRHICTEAAVLAYWHNCLHQPNTHQPAVLPIFGYSDSLQGTVAKVGGRGVSVQTVLPRLLANGNVEQVGKHYVRLVDPNWRFIEDNEDEVLDYGVQALCSLVATIEHNVLHRHEAEEKRVERRVYSHNINEEIFKQSQDEFNALLRRQQQEFSELIRSKESKLPNAKGRTIGAGYYLWRS